ncbi:calmodulin-like protein 4a isoform X2 [Synchiropus splendidus]|uniref:calmodulin-like protein 4a isoform X2 n=1 Tax=Synchiropus splendidus TaxID=270530 RepID=UPI00237EC215|nr:calmodulin-like protein 4a isoform X2 [Synchiropus splendidus]
MAKFFTPAQINEFKECFSLYDKNHKGRILVKDLITVMRCLGTSPTFGEIDRHLQVNGISKTGEVDFSTFLTMMHRQMQQEDPKAEILEALRMTDRQKRGYIQASELRTKLTKLGEKLTDKEGSISPCCFILYYHTPKHKCKYINQSYIFFCHIDGHRQFRQLCSKPFCSMMLFMDVMERKLI